MAKRSTRGIATTTKDTGIYVTTSTKIPALDVNREAIEAGWRAFIAAQEKYEDPLFLLTNARETAQQYVLFIIGVDHGEKTWDPSLGELCEVRGDAYGLRTHADAALAHLRNGDAQRAVTATYWVGRLYEKLRFARPAEPFALAGKRRRSMLRELNARKQLTLTEVRAQLREWDAAIKATGYRSTAQALGRLGIPRATYYDYRARLRKRKKSRK